MRSRIVSTFSLILILAQLSKVNRFKSKASVILQRCFLTLSDGDHLVKLGAHFGGVNN